jgi:hypothetical protein
MMERRGTKDMSSIFISSTKNFFVINTNVHCQKYSQRMIISVPNKCDFLLTRKERKYLFKNDMPPPSLKEMLQYI